MSTIAPPLLPGDVMTTDALMSWSTDVTSSSASPNDVTSTASSSWLADVNTTREAVQGPAGCLVMAFSVYSPWSHPEDLVTYSTQQNFNRFVNVYLLTLLVLVAVPSNLLNLVVFWRHGLKERINLCLFCLAFADLVTVLGHFEWNLDGLYAEITGQPYTLVVMKFNVNHMIHSLAGFIYISGFMSTLIAFERCLCILWPLKAQRIIQTRTTAIIILVGHVLIFAGHYLIATRWEVVCMFDPLIQQTTDAFFSSQFYLSHKGLVDLFDGIIFGILLPGLYVAAILVSTAMTVYKLRQMAEWREQSANTSAAATKGGNSSNASKDVTLTRMLIGTSCLFIACTTPPLIFHAMLPFVPELSLHGKYYNTYYLLINMQQMFTYINASVNFFVYYIFGSKFRHSVQAMFCRARLEARMAARKSAIERSTQLSTVTRTFNNISDTD